MTRQQARLAASWHRISAGKQDRDIPTVLGRYRLRPAQVAAVAQVRSAMREFGGALLADPPGAGKTIVALAVARDAPDAMVVAPAALREQWERSAERAGVPLRFTSFESLSRDARPSVERGGVVIVDEAHHARTPGTRRHARLATLCTGARVLLLSATPVVNRAADRAALLGLFAGERATADPAAMSRCVIRRDEVRDRLPEVRRLPPLEPSPAADGSLIATMLHALPPPLAAADGTGALALIRITLAMAWSSSLAALDAALRRRLQRGEALLDSLVAGSWPSRAALRRWVIGDDATQLAFQGLDDLTAAPPANGATMLRAHLEAVRALRAVVAPGVGCDTVRRGEAIERLQRSRPGERVVVFARHAETVRALWSSMRGAGGVVAIVGGRVLAAAGRWRRDEVLSAIGPRAAPLRADDPHMIRVLLATDLLSEGVELQGVSTVVHADRAWTPATMEQREGRVVRPEVGIGFRGPLHASARVVCVTRFRPPEAATPLLRLGERLAAKGRERRLAVRDAECHAAVERAFARWRSRQSTVGAQALSAGRVTAFLVSIRLGDAAERLVAGVLRGNGWRLSTAPCTIARVAGYRVAASPAAGTGVTDAMMSGAAALPGIRRVLARWARRHATRELLGAHLPTGGRTGATWRRLRAAIDRMLREAPFAERARRAAALAHTLAIIERSSGAGLERRLRELLREAAAGRMNGAALETSLHALARAAGRDAPCLTDEPGDVPLAGDPRGPRVSRMTRPRLHAIVWFGRGPESEPQARSF